MLKNVVLRFDLNVYINNFPIYQIKTYLFNYIYDDLKISTMITNNNGNVYNILKCVFTLIYFCKIFYIPTYFLGSTYITLTGNVNRTLQRYVFGKKLKI